MVQSVFYFIKKEKEDVMNATILDKGQVPPRLLSSFIYSIPNFIEKINPKDEKIQRP